MKPIYNNNTLKVVSAIAIISGLFVGLWYYHSGTIIYQFSADRDTHFVKKQFDRDQYWLSDNPDTNPDILLKNLMSPAKKNKWGHDVYTSILFDGQNQAGFVSYYKERFNQGKILFLSVDPEYRGKNYGVTLLEHAIKELHAMDVVRIVLVTRVINTWAQNTYKKLGFIESSNDGTFVSFIKQF